MAFFVAALSVIARFNAVAPHIGGDRITDLAAAVEVKKKFPVVPNRDPAQADVHASGGRGRGMFQKFLEVTVLPVLL